MRAAYFDAFGGASGDMVLGALLDAGAPLAEARGAVRRLGIRGLDLAVRRVRRAGLSAAKAFVRAPAAPPSRGRRLPEIERLLGRVRLDTAVRRDAVAVFRRLGEAEAKVHGVPLRRVHFHEVGALDALADVVGSCAAFHALGLGRAAVSPLPVGPGEGAAGHGRIPLPGPAVAELLKGFEVRPAPGAGETVTPTGAALLAVLGAPGTIPPMRLSAVGTGAGDRDEPGRPNVLRVLVGDAAPAPWRADRVAVLETQLDDASPQILGALFEAALAAGALDVFEAPVLMKKNRPGVLVAIVAPPERAPAMADLLFRETPTLGVRVRVSDRWILDREVRTVRTPYGPVRVKLGLRGDEVVNAVPEFESVRAAAARRGVPVKRVMRAAAAAVESAIA